MRISTDKFTHDATAKKFTAEASDLESGWLEGITLVSPRKTTASFFLQRTERDADNDITCWVFTCSTNPRVSGYELVIFND